MRISHCFAVAVLLLSGIGLGPSAVAKVEPFPASFKVTDLKTSGAIIHVRVGGQGPAVLLLHGFGDTGDMWQPLALRLMKDHTVVVPDLRGMGLSSHPPTGYDKKTEAQDTIQVLDQLKIASCDLVTHDLGNMVGFALAAMQPKRVTRWVVMDAPLPGIGHWDDQLRNPKTWHFNFYGPDEERLVSGRERIYLDRFYNELSADPKHIDEETRAHYASLYARPQAIHDAFAQFAAFSQDAIDNQAFLAKGKLTMPVLAIGGDKSYGTSLATEIGFVASNVTPLSIPNSGHWLMEEQPEKTIAAIMQFIGKKDVETSNAPGQLTPNDDAAKSHSRSVLAQALPNAPGKTLTAVEVNYAPGESSPPHRHAGSVLAYVVSGEIRSENSATGPARVYHAGEAFFEPPGSVHSVSANASTREPAKLLAIFVADDGATLTQSAK